MKPLLPLLFLLVPVAPLRAEQTPGLDTQPNGGVGPCNAVIGCRVVGPGGGLCEFATVQAAVNTGAVEIRVVQATYAESVNVTDRTVTLIGGYSGCADAANGVLPLPGARSALAPAAGRALNLQQNSSSAMTVEVRNFDVRGNTNADGGGVRIAGNAALTPRSLAVRLAGGSVSNDPG